MKSTYSQKGKWIKIIGLQKNDFKCIYIFYIRSFCVVGILCFFVYFYDN